MKISLIKKSILVIVPIRLVSFSMFYLSGWKGYEKIMHVWKQQCCTKLINNKHKNSNNNNNKIYSEIIVLKHHGN